MRMLIRPGRLAALILALALVVASAPVSAYQTQEFEPDFYVSELTGFEIEVSGPTYEIVDVELQHYPTGEGEILSVGSDTAVSNLEVSFFDDADTPRESIDVYLQSIEVAADDFEVVDSGVSGDIHYAVANIFLEGVNIVFYLQVEEDVVGNADLFQSILSAPFSLADDLEAAQTEVTIDGVPFMDNVDPDELLNVLDGEGSLGDVDESATPVSSENTQALPESGVEVGIGPDFTFAEVSEDLGDLEAVRFVGPNSRSMVAVGTTGSSPEVVLNSFASGIEASYGTTENLAEEIEDDYAWRLLVISPETGDVTYMLIWADTSSAPGYEVMNVHEMTEGSVAATLELIQEQVTINGQPVLSEIDPDEIGALADEEDTTPAAVTPEVTEAPTEETSGDPREDARLPGVDDDDVETGNTSETGGDEAGTELTSPGGEDVPGDLTDSSWEGGVHGLLIEWDAATWFVDSSYEGDLVSNEANQEDLIVLQPQSASSSYLYISLYGGLDTTPQDYLAFWSSEEYLDTYRETGAEIEVLETRTRGGSIAVLLAMTTPGGEEYFVIQQAVNLESGELMLVTLDVPAEDVLDVYENAQQVTLDGESIMQVFSPSQLERIVVD